MTALEPDLGLAPERLDPAALFTPQLPTTLSPQRITSNLAGTPRTLPVIGQQQPIPGRDTTAIIPNLPDAEKAFVRKYQRLTPVFGNLPSEVKAGLVKVDLQRVNKGQAPLSDKETLAAILAVTGEKAITKPQENDSIAAKVLGVPGAVLDDASMVLKSIPHLPGAIVNEVRELPQIAERYQENLDAGMNPVTALLESPGIRMVPGAFIASNLSQGTEGIENMLEHPGLTTLDALPFAGKLAAGTKVAQTAAAEAGTAVGAAAFDRAILAGSTVQEATEIAGKAAVKAEGASRPLKSVLTRKLSADGPDPFTGSELVPNRIGQAADAVARTGPGRFIEEVFGKTGREMSSVKSTLEEKMQAALYGKAPVEGIEQVARDATSFRLASTADDFDIDPARRVELTEQYQLGDAGWRDGLPAHEQAWLAEADDLYSQVRSQYLAQSDLRELGGEVYTPGQAKKIEDSQRLLDKATGKLAARVLPQLDALIEGSRRGVVEGPAAAWLNDGRNTAAKAALDREIAVRDLVAQAADPASPTTWSDVNKYLNGVAQSRTNFGSPGAVGRKTGPEANIKLGTLAGIHRDVRKLARAERVAGKAADVAPARWGPRIVREAEQRVAGTLIQKGVDPAEAVPMVLERRYGAHPDFTQRLMDRTIREVEPTWRKMRDEGHEPQWVHRVQPGQESVLVHPQITAKARNPAASKDRLLGSEATHYQDLTVGLDHAARELLQREATDAMLGQVEVSYARPTSQLRDRYLADAQKRAESNPLLDVEGQTTKRISEDWVPWDKAKFGGTSVAKAASSADQLWIPKSLARNMDRLFNPKQTGFLKAIDPVTSLFRVSVLALSPRWHVYNVIGNAIMLMAEEGPSAFKYWADARKLIKDAHVGGELSAARLPEQVRFSLGSTLKELGADTDSFMRGSNEASRWAQIQKSKPAAAAGAVVKKSYQLNGFFDDTTRIMAFLSGEKRAMGAGLSDNAAAEAGMQSARRVSQFWNELSPMERDVLRRVFPFYSFTSKIMRMVMRYPLDHPVRAAILANFAEAEMADMGDGLPSDWMNSIGVGGVDKDGNQTRISLSGMNPFADVADLFTLKGFLSGINPVGATVLQQLGADPGGSSAFGTKTYDKETGKLTTQRPGLLGALVGNTVPQLGTLNRVLGRDGEFNELRRNNPEAAQRMLVSGVGFPTSIRRVNVPEVRIKSELARIEAQRQAWSNALSTGDFSEAEKFPALRPLIDQLKTLREAGQLASYNPRAGAPAGVSGLVSSVASSAPWPT